MDTLKSGEEITSWIVALVALSTLWLQIRGKRQEMSKVQMQEALKPINDTLERFSGHHTRHFLETGELSRAITKVAQQVTDHNATCEQRDRRIEGMFSEIRNILMRGRDD